jgi:hypothetical protein
MVGDGFAYPEWVWVVVAMSRLPCALGLMLIASPAFAGTATCAGKAYRDVTYATIEPVGNTEIVRLWVGEVTDDTVIKRIGPKHTLVLNSDVMCEFEDVSLHVVTE